MVTLDLSSLQKQNLDTTVPIPSGNGVGMTPSIPQTQTSSPSNTTSTEKIESRTKISLAGFKKSGGVTSQGQGTSSISSNTVQNPSPVKISLKKDTFGSAISLQTTKQEVVNNDQKISEETTQENIQKVSIPPLSNTPLVSIKEEEPQEIEAITKSPVEIEEKELMPETKGAEMKIGNQEFFPNLMFEDSNLFADIDGTKSNILPVGEKESSQTNEKAELSEPTPPLEETLSGETKETNLKIVEEDHEGITTNEVLAHGNNNDNGREIIEMTMAQKEEICISQHEDSPQESNKEATINTDQKEHVEIVGKNISSKRPLNGLRSFFVRKPLRAFLIGGAFLGLTGASLFLNFQDQKIIKTSSVEKNIQINTGSSLQEIKKSKEKDISSSFSGSISTSAVIHIRTPNIPRKK